MQVEQVKLLTAVNLFCQLFIVAMRTVNCNTAMVSTAERNNAAIVSNSGPYFDNRLMDRLYRSPRRKRRANYYYRRRIRYRRLVGRDSSVYLEKQHNRYRRSIEATNMEYMYYDQQLAASAQRHADRCDFAHSNDRARHVGENIWAAPFSNYRNAVWLWFREGRDYGCSNWYRHICGHYTQVMWHSSNRFGCGYATCNGIVNVPYGYHTHILVCQYHYGQRAVDPAFDYGRSCSNCPKRAPRCYNGLCTP